METDEPSLSGLTEIFSVNDQIQHAVSQLKEMSDEDREARINALIENSRVSIAEGHYEMALLHYLEYSLATGDQASPWNEEERNSLAASPEVRTLSAAANNPSNSQQAEAMVNALVSIRNKLGDEAYALKIFEANSRAFLGASESAKNLMIEVLGANPLIVSAWVDLGNFYFKEFRAAEAWFCWDMARSIASDHHMLVQIENFEAQLQSKHPALF